MWTEKHEHVIVLKLYIRQVTAYGFVHHSFCPVYSRAVQNLRNIISHHIRTWQEIFFIWKFFEQRQHIRHCFLPKTYFSLSVNNMFLQIVRNSFRLTDISHTVRHLETKLFCQPKIMVNSSSTCEYYPCIL